MKRMLERVLEKENPSNKNEYSLSFDCECVEFELSTGEKYQGSFKVIADDKGKPEGYVFCDNPRMTLLSNEFGGLCREIAFSFDATGLKEGVEVSDVFCIVSNLGEYELGFKAQINSAVLSCQYGEIRNLFHFANLAKSNWKEAVELFYSPLFVNILNGNDYQYRNYYKGLAVYSEDEEGNKIYCESNVDVFLELTKKKNRIKYSADIQSIEIKDPVETVMKTILLKRDGWGYTNLKLYSDIDFIFFDNSEILSEDFNDNIAQIPVYININELYKGRNFGNIIIEGINQKIVIPVKVSVKVRTTKGRKNAKRRDNLHIMKLYTLYRLGKISKSEFVRECSVTVTRMISDDADDIAARLYQAHLYIFQKRENDARSVLETVKQRLDSDTNPEIIGYSLYLEYMLSKNEKQKAELARNIELLYVQDKTNYRLLWLLLYSKEELLNNDKERWKLIKQQYIINGCNSPLIFIEALSVMMLTPSLMIQLSEFEYAFLAFAMKNDAMTGEIRSRLTYLAEKEIVFSQELYDLLAYSYDKDPRDETLVQICTLLMKGNKFGQEYFKWYDCAVENELRINKLYEYYIMSIDMNYNGRLPKIVLMYFAYRSNLDYERNAFLYANVLKHKPAYQDIYNDYLPVIEDFACISLINHRINDNLAFIYKTVLGKKLFEDRNVRHYGYLLFVYKIKVFSSVFDSVIVINENLAEEQRYPIYNCEAMIPIVGNRYSLLLEDADGNRYVDQSYYEIQRVIKNEPDFDKVIALCGSDLYPALYLAETGFEQMTVNDSIEDALIYISSHEQVSEDFKLSIMIELAEYYFDHDDIAKLDELMLRFSPESLGYEQREKCIRIMIARGMYDRALDWVREYGCEYVDDKILVRLCDRVLMRSDYEYEHDVLGICEMIFNDNRYDETILNYLLLYKQGSSKNLKRLWRAADSFSLNVHSLLEAIIVQLLYSGVKIGEESNIFLEYIKDCPSPELEKAFLDKLSYNYFVLEEKVDIKVFDRIVYLNHMGENLSDYAKMAFLKSCDSMMQSGKNLNAEQKALIVLYVKEFTMRHMVFPFFLSFIPLWPKLAMYKDRSFIEYRGDENSKVILHYVYEHENGRSEDYYKEEIPHILGGIFVISFILFHGEKIKYYITEEGPRSEKLTKASVLSASDSQNADIVSRYSLINDMAHSKQKNDDNTFCRLSEEYIKKSYMVDALFTPDRGE